MWEDQEPPPRSASQDTWALGRPFIRLRSASPSTARSGAKDAGGGLMLIRLRFPVIASLFWFLAASAAHAQPPGPGSVVFDPSGNPTIKESIVVTATGTEEPASKVGASVTVITSDDIEHRHALNTIDLLRTVPGVMAVRTGGIGNLTSLF